MTLGVVGESWGVIQQTASHGLPSFESSDVARDPHAVRMLGSAHAPLQPDVNAADDAWDVRDYSVSDGHEPLNARAPAPPEDGFLPGLLPEVPEADADLPLFKNIRRPVADIDTDDNSASLEDEEADSETPVFEESVAAPDEIEDLLEDDDFDFEVEATEDLGASLSEDRDERASDWDVDVGLPDFDPDARIEPWIIPQEADDTARRKARLKAASLAAELDLTTIAEVVKATNYLIDFYCRQSHPTTHHALMRLAGNGLDLDTLRAMVDLRRDWARRSDWWLYRYKGEAQLFESCLSAMTWQLAHDVCRSRSEFPSDSMIDQDWVNEWYTLRFGAPGYYSFASLIAEKVESEEAALLCDGLRQAPGDHRDVPDLGDHHSDLYRVNANRREA